MRRRGSQEGSSPPSWPISRTLRGPVQLFTLGAAALLVMLLVSAAAPPDARADVPIIGPIVNGILGGIGGDIVQIAVSAFEAIIKALFAPMAKFITTQLIGWLITVPNYALGNVTVLEQTVGAMAAGLLGAVATVSVIRYWAVGFAGGGDGFSALEGLTRTVGAVLFIAVWPWLFSTAVHLTNLFTNALMGSRAVVTQSTKLLAGGLGLAGGSSIASNAFGLFLVIAILVAATLLFLGLLVMKVIVGVSTILIFVGMPLAAVVWPIVPWAARLALRAFAMCLLVPVLWALCFASAVAVGLNAVTFNGGKVLNTLLQPLVAIVLLWLMVRLPTHLARVAMLGGAPLGGGFVSRAVSYAAGAQIRDGVRSTLGSRAGARTGQDGGQAEQDSRTASRLRNAATIAGAAATGGAGAAAAAMRTIPTSSVGSTGADFASGGAKANGANGRAYTPPPTAQASAAGQPLQDGLQTPSFRDADFKAEIFEAKFRERTDPVSAAQAEAALASLPAETQYAMGQLVADHGAGAREHIAYQALGEWSAQEREGIRTLAAANPEIRAEAIDAVHARNAQASYGIGADAGVVGAGAAHGGSVGGDTAPMPVTGGSSVGEVGNGQTSAVSPTEESPRSTPAGTPATASLNEWSPPASVAAEGSLPIEQRSPTPGESSEGGSPPPAAVDPPIQRNSPSAPERVPQKPNPTDLFQG